jgi:threonine/homoserine/homoserine lactone efflux protein
LVTTFSYLYAYIQIAIALIFIVIASFLWFSKSNHITKSTEKNGFLLGSVLAILNPQLILFWTTVIAYLHINNFLGINLFESYKLYLPFCLGAAIGAFCLHVCIIYLSKKFANNSFDFFVKYIDKIIALIFVMLAIIQIIKIIQTWQK